jgi:hypothetical protein
VALPARARPGHAPARRPAHRPHRRADRQEVEDRHLDLLLEYGLQHLDLPEITTRRRPITQTIAADLFDRGVSVVRFPSKLDGNPCFALFEGRGALLQPATQLRSPTRRPSR